MDSLTTCNQRLSQLEEGYLFPSDGCDAILKNCNRTPMYTRFPYLSAPPPLLPTVFVDCYSIAT